MSQRVPDYDAMRAREKGREVGKIGDKVTYAVMKQNPFGQWLETDCPTMGTMGQAVGMVRHYQEDRPGSTFAVARLELVMISRPSKEDA